VAPNGARKTKADHPMLPISPQELADEARACIKQGAAMIHLHVRDDNDGHILDVGRYRDATKAIRDEVGERIIIQATTEAVGLYSPRQQMDVVLELQPEAASLAIQELVPEGNEAEASAFFAELKSLKIMPQFILYSPEDLIRFQELTDAGVIPFENPFLLFVMGRYTENQQSHPADLLAFMPHVKPEMVWAVCAFGPYENAVASCALALGGHVRVGFENNMMMRNRELAGRNADLVWQAKDVADAVGRSLASAEDVRQFFN
jgi:uncharacterized protein (DUF849 family)